MPASFHDFPTALVMGKTGITLSVRFFAIYDSLCGLIFVHIIKWLHFCKSLEQDVKYIYKKDAIEKANLKHHHAKAPNIGALGDCLCGSIDPFSQQNLRRYVSIHLVQYLDHVGKQVFLTDVSHYQLRKNSLLAQVRERN